MESKKREAEQEQAEAEEPWMVENATDEDTAESKTARDVKATPEEKEEPKKKVNMLYFGPNNGADKKVFMNGLSVGLGVGCITTFIVMWIAVFFTPQMPPNATYQDLLSIFIFPMIYLLAIGLICLTSGLVREYYMVKFKP
jgi:hypothetical protein